MKTILSLIYPLAGIYLLFLGLLYLMQRTMLYYPVPAPGNISAETISFDNEGVKLQGWRLNRGQPRALVYFGGNAETITGNISQFKSLFSDYTVYLVNYRGYGDSEGKPTEAALFSDALAIYDQIQLIQILTSVHMRVHLLNLSLLSKFKIWILGAMRIYYI
ncbi:MAG: hypothetical protein IIC09_02195 [Proteobacteria bacterium]|nr:hypothetical protein [Pseudomonadota bacterium]